MATFNDLTEYYNRLQQAFQEKAEAYYYNTDRSHNATVMRFMFDNATNIKMYCGELSVLRKNFYEHIVNDGMGEKDVDSMKKAMSQSLLGFLNKENSRLEIVLENYSENIFMDLICEELFLENMRKKKIRLYKLDNELSFKKNINHFSYTDTNILRFEEDKTLHNAICVFHNDSYLKGMGENFEILLRMADEVKGC